MAKDKVVSDVLGEENAVTPSDLYSQEFSNSMMGYDKEEVDNFLERVADAFEHLNSSHRDLKKEYETQREELDTLRAMENTLRGALVSSEKFSENVIESAKLEAEAMLEQAKLAKTKAELEASKLCDDLKHEIHELKAARDRLRRDLELLVETHSSMIARIPVAEDQPKPEVQLEKSEEKIPDDIAEKTEDKVETADDNNPENEDKKD